MGACPSAGRCPGRPPGRSVSEVWPLTCWVVPLVGARGQARGVSATESISIGPQMALSCSEVGSPGPPALEPRSRLGSGPCRGGRGSWGVPQLHSQPSQLLVIVSGEGGPHTPTSPPLHWLACVGAPGRDSPPGQPAVMGRVAVQGAQPSVNHTPAPWAVRVSSTFHGSQDQGPKLGHSRSPP